MILTQVGIAVFGVAAVWLSQDARPSWRKWSSTFGLAGQPFWIIETISAQQWGILALCALYTWSWARGFRTHWLRRESA
jgi:hypothetical protein